MRLALERVQNVIGLMCDTKVSEITIIEIISHMEMPRMDPLYRVVKLENKPAALMITGVIREISTSLSSHRRTLFIAPNLKSNQSLVLSLP